MYELMHKSTRVPPPYKRYTQCLPSSSGVILFQLDMGKQTLSPYSRTIIYNYKYRHILQTQGNRTRVNSYITTTPALHGPAASPSPPPLALIYRCHNGWLQDYSMIGWFLYIAESVRSEATRISSSRKSAISYQLSNRMVKIRSRRTLRTPNQQSQRPLYFCGATAVA